VSELDVELFADTEASLTTISLTAQRLLPMVRQKVSRKRHVVPDVGVMIRAKKMTAQPLPLPRGGNMARIAGVKTLGDACVPTGHESFNGTVTGNSGKVRSWLGTPGSQPVLSSSDEDLKMLDANTFTVSGQGNNLKVTRVTAPN
jgi:hypothetical protein